MNVRLAQSEEEWAAVRAVLCSFATNLQPVTTPDAVVQALQTYAQQMTIWWKGRNHAKRGIKRGDRLSDATSEDTHSATSDEPNGEPDKKKTSTQHVSTKKPWNMDDTMSLWGPTNSLPMSTDSGLLSVAGRAADACFLCHVPCAADHHVGGCEQSAAAAVVGPGRREGARGRRACRQPQQGTRDRLRCLQDSTSSWCCSTLAGRSLRRLSRR